MHSGDSTHKPLAGAVAVPCSQEGTECGGLWPALRHMAGGADIVPHCDKILRPCCVCLYAGCTRIRIQMIPRRKSGFSGWGRHIRWASWVAHPVIQIVWKSICLFVILLIAGPVLSPCIQCLGASSWHALILPCIVQSCVRLGHHELSVLLWVGLLDWANRFVLALSRPLRCSCHAQPG